MSNANNVVVYVEDPGSLPTPGNLLKNVVVNAGIVGLPTMPQQVS
jgi:hypothetical protein